MLSDVPVSDRITSYNVCYTKLLRIKESRLVQIREAPATEYELRAIAQECLERAKRHPDGFVEVEMPGVITSYSIHYTKLYDFFLSNKVGVDPVSVFNR